MCLVALALGQHPRYPLVLASNRDEFFDREALPLDWWQPEAGASALLSGRDLTGGGTWLGLSATGRLALLTNVRAPQAQRTDATSRGGIVMDWLTGHEPAEPFADRHQARTYSGFNALTADLLRGSWHWFSNHPAARRTLEPGLWGLSNAALDTPWPKVTRLKARLQAALAGASGDEVDWLVEPLFAALGDRTPAPAEALPRTGLAPEHEHLLSSPFIHIPGDAFGRAYGTRCSTLVVAERQGAQLRVMVIERSFDRHGQPSREQRHTWLAP